MWLFVLATAFALITFAIGRAIFPLHTLDTDESILLLQANGLLHGRLFRSIHEFTLFEKTWAERLVGNRMVFKYTPAFPTVLALGELLLGSARAITSLIAGALIFLVYFQSRALKFSRGTSFWSCLFFLLAPFSLVLCSTELSYATSLALELTFSVLLLHGLKKERPLLLGFAGAAISYAFWIRPFDAVLWSLPMLGYALTEMRGPWRKRVTKLFPVAIGALPGLIAFLAYNYISMGSPFKLTYSLDPSDAPGFGLHRAVSSAPYLTYTPRLAITTIQHVLKEFAQVDFGGPILLLLAAFGLTSRFSRREKLLVSQAGIFIAGYFCFWGTYGQMLAGSGQYLGPFYFYPLLVPVSILAACGISKGKALGRLAQPSLLILMGLYSSLALSGLLRHNALYTEKFRSVYAPLTEAKLSKAVVIVPTYGQDGVGVLFPQLINSFQERQPVIYAAALSNSVLNLWNFFPSRSIYRFEYHNSFELNELGPFSSALIPLKKIRFASWQPSLAIHNPTPFPYVFVYGELDTDWKAYLVDEHSSEGKGYQVQWKLTPDGISSDMDSKKAADLWKGQARLSAPITLGVIFSPDPRGNLGLHYEYRVPFHGHEKAIDAVWPPQKWANTEIYGGMWMRKELEPALKLINSPEPGGN